MQGEGARLHLRVRNEHQALTMFYSVDGMDWKRFPSAMEVSGYNHNNFGEFLGLRLGLYAAGSGEAEFSEFRYRAI
ncbi:hypothetical protein D3C75_1187540 [compost metagenome]